MNAVQRAGASLPQDLIQRLAEKGVDMAVASALPAPDHATIAREAAEERRALVLRRRQERWAERSPPMYADASLGDLVDDPQQRDAGRTAARWWGQPESLTLMAAGPVGTGKTHLAYALGNAAVDEALWAEAWTVPDYLEAIRPNGDPRAAERARDCDLLILDDLNDLNVTPWASEQMTNLLDHRVAARKRQVVTTNVPSATLEEAWGGRLLDRLAYRWTVVVMKGDSRRRAAW